MQHIASRGLGLGLGARSAQSQTGATHLSSSARSLHVHVPRTGAHLPPYAPVNATTIRPGTTTASKILQSTRTAFTRFFTHLTTPGFSHPVAGGNAYTAGRSLSTRIGASVRPPTIQQGLSFSARHALSPARTFLPKPSPVPRNVVDVGLGTARKFSTARPIFQHLVQNVPVAGRAVYEADWDLERKMMKDKVRRKMTAGNDTNKENKTSQSVLKPMKKTSSSFAIEEELEHYFPSEAPITPGVTTILLVPLAPSPTSRLPLSTSPPSTEPHLLVFTDIQDVLSSHRTHSLRVSSLFARLDVANVWERGASFTAHGDASGLCTVLRVEFEGWSEAMVKKVLGDAGKGWCKVVEVTEFDESEIESGMNSLVSSRSSSSSGLDSPRRSARAAPPTEPNFDPAASFVIPTLDFSSSFLATRDSRATTPAMSFPPSPALSDIDLSDAPASMPSLSDYDIESMTEDELSDSDYSASEIGSDGSAESWASATGVASSGTGSVLEFSSVFLARASEIDVVDHGPRDHMF